jgi:hypothetical protein
MYVRSGRVARMMRVSVGRGKNGEPVPSFLPRPTYWIRFLVGYRFPETSVCTCKTAHCLMTYTSGTLLRYDVDSVGMWRRVTGFCPAFRCVLLLSSSLSRGLSFTFQDEGTVSSKLLEALTERRFVTSQWTWFFNLCELAFFGHSKLAMTCSV